MSLHLNRYDIEIGKAQRIGPFQVTIHHHEGPENPWENWDCMTPMLTYSESTQTYDSGDGIEDFFSLVTPAWVSRNWRKIAAILEIDEAVADQEMRDYGGSLSDSRYDYFETALSEKAPSSRCWGTACDYFDVLEALYDLAGIPALSTQRNGYSQGDCVRILLVATPAHAKRCGWAPDYDPNPGLKTDADLYGAWAWGDVYGYSIDDAKTGEQVDSCFGFYGTDDVVAEVESVMNFEIENRKRERLDAIKRWIRNRVPLLIRAEMLGEMS